VSDNCSTDGTSAICELAARDDPRIRYIRQPENMGRPWNFRRVLTESRGEYFLWAASDDQRSADFIEVNLSFLQRHPDFVASVSPVRFSNGTFNPIRMGDAELDQGCAEDRVVAFFRDWHANGRYYSLFRRQAIASSQELLQPEYFAFDWSIVLELAMQGKFHRADQGELVLGTGGVSLSEGVYKYFRKEAIEFALPFWRLSRFVLEISRDFKPGNRRALRRVLAQRTREANRDRFRRARRRIKRRLRSYFS